MLNVDYKIISKSLANRLRLVISQVVNPSQTCGVPGRSIEENCTLLGDICDYVDRF